MPKIIINNKEIEDRNNLSPIHEKKNNIPYLVDQHLLDKNA